jgi:hypothetical protein
MVGTVQKDLRILKGCERSSMALIVALASLQDADPYYISTRGLRFAPQSLPPEGNPPLATISNPFGVKSRK